MCLRSMAFAFAPHDVNVREGYLKMGRGQRGNSYQDDLNRFHCMAMSFKGVADAEASIEKLLYCRTGIDD